MKDAPAIPEILTAVAPMAVDRGVERAASFIIAGDLVAIPTETVYGLAADATNDRAVAKIFEAKGRPSFNPLIVHVADLDMARRYADFPPLAEKLARAFWPGPLTLVLPRKKDCGLSLLVSAGLETVALRAPKSLIARQIIEKSGRPLAAPSANRSGSISPTQAEHVRDSLGRRVRLIFDGGACSDALAELVQEFGAELPEDESGIGRMAEPEAIADYGIQLHTMSEVTSVDADSQKVTVTAVGEGGTDTTLPFDMLHVVPRQSAPDWVKSSALSTGDDNGYVEVDKFTMAHVRYPNVFALGDVGSTPNGKTGAAIRKQAPAVVANIDAYFKGCQPTAKYDGYSSCPIVTSTREMLMAEFDYDFNITPTLPLVDSTKPHRAYWYLKKYGLPALYWNLMLKGLG